MNRTPRHIPPAVLDAAIDWSLKVTFNTPDAAARQAFEHWLAADELHRSAWQRIQGLHGQFAALPAQAARATLNKLPDTRLQRRQLLKFVCWPQAWAPRAGPRSARRPGSGWSPTTARAPASTGAGPCPTAACWT